MGGERQVYEGGDIYIYIYIYIYTHLRLIHIDVRQKPTQYCKALILQLNINKLELVTVIQGAPRTPYSNGSNMHNWGTVSQQEADNIVSESISFSFSLVPCTFIARAELFGTVTIRTQQRCHRDHPLLQRTAPPFSPTGL